MVRKDYELQGVFLKDTDGDGDVDSDDVLDNDKDAMVWIEINQTLKVA